MAPTTSDARCTQTKAILVICLLAGHEVGSIRSKAGMFDGSGKVEHADEDKQIGPSHKESNQRCKWRGVCVGEGCKSRPLPLDKNPSESCRLSTKHMLNSDVFPMYVDEMTSLFDGKLPTYRTKCILKENRSKEWIKKGYEAGMCARRMGLLIHASLFLTSASAKLAAFPADQYTEERAKIMSSIGKGSKQFAAIFGEDHDLVLEFLQSAMKKPLGSTENARTFYLHITTLLSSLESKDPAVKEEARKGVRELIAKMSTTGYTPMGNSTTTSMQKEFTPLAETDETMLEEEADARLPALVEEASERGSSLVELATTGCTSRRLIWIFVLPLLSVPTFGLFAIYLLFDMIFGWSWWKWVTCEDKLKGGKEVEALKAKNEELMEVIEKLNRGRRSRH